MIGLIDRADEPDKADEPNRPDEPDKANKPNRPDEPNWAISQMGRISLIRHCREGAQHIKPPLPKEGRVGCQAGVGFHFAVFCDVKGGEL